jgi:hypothetical protein
MPRIFHLLVVVRPDLFSSANTRVGATVQLTGWVSIAIHAEEEFVMVPLRVDLWATHAIDVSFPCLDHGSQTRPLFLKPPAPGPTRIRGWV